MTSLLCQCVQNEGYVLVLLESWYATVNIQHIS